MADPLSQSDRDWAVDTLGLLVAHESPSGALRHVNALRDVLCDLLRAAGARVDVVAGPGGDHIVADLGEHAATPYTLVLGHYDTVWPVGRLQDAPFTVTGDVATGPGVFDMKSGLVSLLHALELVRRHDRLPPRPVRIVLTADEEVGSPDGARVVGAAANDAAVVFALEPPLADGALKVGRRGVARVALEVHGREAHTGLDLANGVSAIDELVDHLQALRQRFPATEQQSLNVGRIEGGSRPNVVPGHAAAELGLRFAGPDAEEQILAALHGLRPIRRGARLHVLVLSHRPAWDPAGSTALAAHVQAVAQSLGETVGTGVSGGAGDANLTGARGIPTVDGLGPRGHGAHAPDETVELPSICARGALLARLLTVEPAAGATRGPAVSAADEGPA
jgi:glutamate carboxypeptidase